ncbi:GlsB/YeaQ/YmgE family stress response membrane protein [Aurantimonas aggregata]|uniref:GlsB/YeaQ/YmgE family stress response membrane protein n=1 Tax=Aurantimonas aggregata TaxID=2047720 RepID=A0A6L9MK20_9HYPH|nr:GlsB/YeaQ/YmgE family stress response membrane protein [Aurantimonas aggregata]NDV88157.1 GlsB/YeaQ/YmgE family stress response membrane protein [Aurantimonas aggregata]
MDVNGVGWIAAIIVGGLAGWLAEQVMKSDMGLLMNIILGIVGAIVLNAILALLGISFGAGWIAYLITGFIGACLLIFIFRAFRGRGRV